MNEERKKKLVIRFRKKQNEFHMFKKDVFSSDQKINCKYHR
jgi:hypothetical protein